MEDRKQITDEDWVQRKDTFDYGRVVMVDQEGTLYVRFTDYPNQIIAISPKNVRKIDRRNI